MKIIRRFVRWTLYVFVILVVLVVAAILLLNTMAKQFVESRLRVRTGLDPRIGVVDVGLLSPTITFENVKLYNKPDFGGSLFVDMPELHLEYDPGALLAGRLHFKFVRLNLAEVSLVQDKRGHVNVQELKKQPDASAAKKSFGPRFKFTGIDTLNLTLGKFHVANLVSGRGQDIDFGIKDQITHNVKSGADLPILNLFLPSRSGPNTSSTNSGFDLSTLLQHLTAR